MSNPIRRPLPLAHAAIDPVGVVVSRMDLADQIIVILASAATRSDRGLARTVDALCRSTGLPRPGWNGVQRGWGGRTASRGIARRVSTALDRLADMADRVSVDVGEIRVSRSAVHVSPYAVRRLAELGIELVPMRRCAAPKCDEVWPIPTTGGQPKTTCSPACRQRLYRSRRRKA